MGLEASYGTTDSSGYKGSWDDEDNSYTFSYSSSLMALQLERISYTTWLGAKIYLPLNRHWSVEFSTAISPFCWMQSLDSHPFGEYKFFLDVMTAYLCGINNSFAAAFNIDSHNAIILGANILSIYGLDGVTYTSEKKDGVFTRISGASGASLLYMNTTLSYRFSL